MKLSKQQFDSAHREQRLFLLHWHVQRRQKFLVTKISRCRILPRYCCDDLIETKLAPQLLAQGYKGIADVAACGSGFPTNLSLKNTSKNI